ncbi:MAG: ShlB/FhaC/HecB family hemolysin secretion/activation protein, partial [Comamonadaceae bacterium]
MERLPTPRMPAPAASEGGQILTAPVPAQPAAAVAVTPASFEIEGVKALPFADVAALFQPLARQPATVAQLTNAARQCTALYQQRGYALSFCFVPQQDFAGAVVRVVAVEGHIATVTIEGDAGGAEPKLRDFAAQLQRERPLTRASFERYTQLMAQLPGLRVVANATPPVRTDGAGLLVLKVSRQPYKLSLGADLRSSQPRAVLSGALNDPFVSGGSLSASTLLGDFKEEKFGTVGYSQLIGNDGLTLKAELSAYEGDPDADLDISPAVRRHNSYRRAELSAAYPLRLSTRGSLYASGGIYAVNNADDYFSPGSGFQLTDEVRHHAVYLQGSYQRASDASAVSLTARLVQGIDAFGAQANVRTTA